VRVSGLDVYDSWAAGQADPSARWAVMEALISRTDPERYDELFNRPAAFGHPLRREFEVAAAGVIVVVILPHPMRGLHLVDIRAV
jgi:hypothetical protein